MNKLMNRFLRKKNIISMVIAVLLAGVLGGGGINAAGPSILLPDSDQTGSLTIHKFRTEDYDNLKEGTGSADDAELPDDAEKLTNVQFKIEKLSLAADEIPTLSSAIDTGFTAITKATDSNGEILFDNLSKGFYIVTEVLPDGYSAEKEQFLVKIPTDVKTSDLSVKDIWEYDVHVYPKNMGSENSVTKVVAGDKVVYGLEDEITWDVSYYIGTGLRKEVTQGGSTSTVYAKNFYLYDVMDSRLDFVAGSTKMEVFDIYQQKLSTISLIEGTDYTETYDENTHTVTWFFTDAGVQKIADNGVVYIDISITTAVNDSALGTADDAVWNNARISFTNASGDPYEMEVFDSNGGKNGVNVPKVWLGRITIDKIDADESDVKLAGAVFKIAESESAAKAGTFMQREGADIEVRTDTKGQAIIDIIGEGTYYLVETQAPKDYKLDSTPIKVVIENAEEGRLAQVLVKNTATDDEPGTSPTPGGTTPGGTVSTGDIVRIAGILLMLAGAAGTIIVVSAKTRKRKEKAI